MKLMSKTVNIKWNKNNKKYYEELGYTFTNFKDEFEVLVKDLPKGSNVKVRLFCKKCNFEKEVLYKDYLKCDKDENGEAICPNCKRNGSKKSKSKHKTRKLKTLEAWCKDNKRDDVLLSWDYELNNCTPSEVSWSSSKKYFFKCLKHQEHKSELKTIWGSITQRNSAITCIQCKSVAQYILDNFQDKDLYEVWDKDKNGELDPWNIEKGSNKKIWIKCQEKEYHNSYNPVVNNFTNGSRCPYCTNIKGMVHPLDSFGQYIVDNYGENFLNSIWSDKNKKSPFEYTKRSNIEVWWKSLDNSVEDFKRDIYSSVTYGFRNPRVLNRLTTKEAINLTQEQMDKGFNIGDNYREFVKKCIERALGYYKKDCMGIYKIRNTINNKVYIGQAVNIEDRWVEHIYSSLSKNRDEYNYPLYNAFRKYGIGNFNFEILEECNTEDLDEKEIYYIKLYNSNIHNQNSHGYNQTDGGYAIRGWKMPEEQRKKTK